MLDFQSRGKKDFKKMTHSQVEEVGKIFVGGLSWETTQENLNRYFSRFGEVVDCVVMKNNETGRSRGFGFVTFKDPNCVSIVLDSGPHELDGRTIDPKACNPRGMQKARPKMGSSFNSQEPKKGGNYPKIFLGGLPSTCTETDLRNFFSKYGKVIEVVIMYDQERKKSRGFGFLSYESEDSVERVCAEHYVNVNGKQVECKRAEPRDMSKSGGKGQGQPPGQWGGPGMGGGPGGWGPGPMGGPGPGGPGGPGMGPGPGGPPGPMGPPMPNGMMAGGYQSGWGGPQQQGPYGPQGGYGTSYQGWGAPPGSYGPYGGPGPQYGQQGYGGYGTPTAPGYGGYSGFGAPMGGAPTPGGPPGAQAPPSDPYGQQGPAAAGGAPPAQPGQPMGGGGGPGQGQKTDYNYNSSYGYGGSGGVGYGSQGDGPHVGGGYGGGGGGGPQSGRAGGQSQGYHPYRRV